MQLIKRVLRYLRGTSHFGLQIYKHSSLDLFAYTDVDWAGCPDTRKSTSGFCVFLGQNLVSWSSKCQPTVSRSSAEAEYRGVANCVAESCWVCHLLHELRRPPTRATIVYCDNVSATYLASNPVQHQRMKYIEIDFISYATVWPSVKHVFFTFHPTRNLLICSLRVCLLMYFMSFVPA